MLKKSILFYILINSSILSANEINEVQLESAWNKQHQYVQILKDLQDSLNKINDKLDSCRETYFKTASDSQKKMYLNDTNKFSTNVLITQSIVGKARTDVLYKMKHEKKLVQSNLMHNFKTLDNYLETEKNRKNKLINNYNDEFSNIREKYCSKE